MWPVKISLLTVRAVGVGSRAARLPAAVARTRKSFIVVPVVLKGKQMTSDPQYPQYGRAFWVVLALVSLPFAYWLLTLILSSFN
jgi:hypothetical protein